MKVSIDCFANPPLRQASPGKKNRPSRAIGEKREILTLLPGIHHSGRQASLPILGSIPWALRNIFGLSGCATNTGEDSSKRDEQ